MSSRIPIDQSEGGIFSFEVLSAQLAPACAKKKRKPETNKALYPLTSLPFLRLLS